MLEMVKDKLAVLKRAEAKQKEIEDARVKHYMETRLPKQRKPTESLGFVIQDMKEFA